MKYDKMLTTTSSILRSRKWIKGWVKPWGKFPDLIIGRHGKGAATINRNIYTVAGCGQRGGNPELDLMEVLSSLLLQ